MKNSIRCCISCILPCGALDVIRIVHSNGFVQEITGSVRASDVIKSHPKHILKKPSSPFSAAASAAAVVPPESELQRGKIYFLMPLPPNSDKARSRSSAGRKKRDIANNNSTTHHSDRSAVATNLLLSDQYLSEILSEKVSTHRERRRGRIGVWRPHLQSICESPGSI